MMTPTELLEIRNRIRLAESVSADVVHKLLAHIDDIEGNANGYESAARFRDKLEAVQPLIVAALAIQIMEDAGETRENEWGFAFRKFRQAARAMLAANPPPHD